VKNEKQNDKPANLVDAINYVMSKARNVEKNLTVGTGNNSYAGVSDKDVKELLQPLLVEAGLVILPIGIEPTVTVDRWEEKGILYGKEVIRQKMRVLTETKVTYKIVHTSGQSMELMSYGHGIDTQDKAPGKATTYALKYLLLYTFLIPTGQIDDADNKASEPTTVPVEKKHISPENFTKALNLVRSGKFTAQKVNDQYKLEEDQLTELNYLANELNANKKIDAKN